MLFRTDAPSCPPSYVEFMSTNRRIRRVLHSGHSTNTPASVVENSCMGVGMGQLVLVATHFSSPHRELNANLLLLQRQIEQQSDI